MNEEAEVLVVAIDPVQFEELYARRVEGISKVRKSTPPNLRWQVRLTWGYPAITAKAVNLSPWPLFMSTSSLAMKKPFSVKTWRSNGLCR